MNQKWKDAVGDIDETYIDEYASYKKKAVWKRWIPYEVLAACALLGLVFGIWKFQNRRTGSDQKGRITAEHEMGPSFFPEKKATSAPRASENAGEQLPSASLQPTEEAVQDNTRNTVNEVRDNMNNNQNEKKQKNTYQVDRDTADDANSDIVPQPTEELIQPGMDVEENLQHSADPEELPTQKPEETIAWNTVTAMAEPYGGRVSHMLNEGMGEPAATQIPDPQKSNMPEMPAPTPEAPAVTEGSDNSAGKDFLPGSRPDDYEKEQALKQLKKKYGDGWLFYYDKEQKFTLERVLQLISEEMREELYMKLHSPGMTVYVVEVKTDKTTLQQADAEDEKSIFGIGTILSKVNGVETYFMKDSYGKMCARFYKDGVLVTAWSENGEKGQMCEFIDYMTK